MSAFDKQAINLRIWALAERIAGELMRNGNGDIADRLVLELPNGKDGGGHCRESVAGVIHKMISSELRSLFCG